MRLLWIANDYGILLCVIFHQVLHFTMYSQSQFISCLIHVRPLMVTIILLDIFIVVIITQFLSI